MRPGRSPSCAARWISTPWARTLEGRKVKGVIHWVSATHAVPVEVRLYDNLFLVEQPDKDKDADFLEHLNPESLEVCQAMGEPSLAGVAPESRFQFERMGYFCADRHACRDGKLVFNRTVGLKDSWAKIQKSDGQKNDGQKKG